MLELPDDPKKVNVMRTHVRGDDGYVTLIWPRVMTLEELGIAREMVNFQLDSFMRHARQKDDGQIEYESWFAEPTNA